MLTERQVVEVVADYSPLPCETALQNTIKALSSVVDEEEPPIEMMN